MPKRKREDGVEEVFLRFRTELQHAFKTAKGFERQRQSKRLKDPTAPREKRARIEKEIVVLKSLDLHQAAHAHLCSALLRIKSIAESPKLPDQVKHGVPKPELTEDERIALHNVTSGLASRKEVRAVIDKAIPAVCKALGVPMPEKGKGKKSDEKEPGESKKSGKPKKSDKKESEEPKRSEEKKTNKESKPLSDDSDEDSEVIAEEVAIAKLDDLLGSSSGEESEAEEAETKGGVGSKTKRAAGAKAAPKAVAKAANPVELDPMEITDDEGHEENSAEDSDLDPMDITEEEDASDPGSDSDASSSEFQGFSDAPSDAASDVSDDYGSDSSSPASPPPKKSKTKSKPSSEAPISGSTFLPALMSGYISDSASEASDLDIAPRTKNRRGQRARQAIWEKRFKEQAKHLQKQKEKRDSGWDMKRGAVGGEDGENKPWKRGIRNPFAKDGGDLDQGHVEVKKEVASRKRDDSGPLHPSWEAKRKAKEAQNASVPFQGKKIVFD